MKSSRSGKPTVKVWRGNTLPHPARHENSTFPPLGRDLGRVKWIAACDVCGWAVSVESEELALEMRRPHLMRAHGPELATGVVTVHLSDPRAAS